MTVIKILTNISENIRLDKNIRTKLNKYQSNILDIVLLSNIWVIYKYLLVCLLSIFTYFTDICHEFSYCYLKKINVCYWICCWCFWILWYFSHFILIFVRYFYDLWWDLWNFFMMSRKHGDSSGINDCAEVVFIPFNPPNILLNIHITCSQADSSSLFIQKETKCSFFFLSSNFYML